MINLFIQLSIFFRNLTFYNLVNIRFFNFKFNVDKLYLYELKLSKIFFYFLFIY